MTNDNQVLDILQGMVQILSKLTLEVPEEIENPEELKKVDNRPESLRRLEIMLAGGNPGPTEKERLQKNLQAADAHEDVNPSDPSFESLAHDEIQDVQRTEEIDQLASLWLGGPEICEMANAETQFDSIDGITKNRPFGSVTVDPKEIDYSPATNAEEAKELVRSRKYRWVFKSDSDGSGSSDSGFRLAKVTKPYGEQVATEDECGTGDIYTKVKTCPTEARQERVILDGISLSLLDAIIAIQAKARKPREESPGPSTFDIDGKPATAQECLDEVKGRRHDRDGK
jgi:hypothetical protein